MGKRAKDPTLDCACLDMEDGVGITMKDAAHAGIVHALQTVDFGRTEVLARINVWRCVIGSRHHMRERNYRIALSFPI